ncbi:hypothetical protein ACFX5U_08415 [Sphingobacterium sp. SG20118]|uniref:hypothetical protein n=1 Tax=Sphingobacterium sp. SG20118 TaxID=3367156 RepID=UPI0037DFC623
MITYLALPFCFLMSCSSNPIDTKVNQLNQTAAHTEEIQPIEEFKAPSKYSFEEISKFAISSLMFQDPKNMTVVTDGNNFIVSYIKDSKPYSYKIKFNKNQIMWGNADGRWRDNDLDEKLYYKEAEDRIEIIMKYSDGSNETKEYHK